MAKQSHKKITKEKKPKRVTTYSPSPIFHASYQEALSRDSKIKGKFDTFVANKSAVPPVRLSTGMKDHKLGKELEGCNECHLAPNILLLYTLKDCILQPILVCTHDDLYGPKAQAMAKLIKPYLN